MRPLRSVLAAALLLAGAPAAPAAFAGGPEGAPRCPDCNLILISLSNVGAGRMSLYGYPRKTTPRLDAWAKDAVVFENNFTPASWTLPVGVSVFTSLYPYAHGVLYRTRNNALAPDVPTLAEILRDHGYRTAAFTGGLDYYSGFSHMRGFQEKADNREFTSFNVTIPQAKEWLGKNSSRKFFLFLHGYDAHCPFIPSKRYQGLFGDPKDVSGVADDRHCLRGFAAEVSTAGITVQRTDACSSFQRKCRRSDPLVLTEKDVRYLNDLYDEKLVELDELIGGFLRWLPPETAKKTVVVIFADHGELFAKHGRFGRTGNMRGAHYDDVLRVPLIMRLPGGPAKRVSKLTELVDVMPTVLPILGLPAPSRMEGVDLAPLIETGKAAERYVYSGANYDMCAPWYPPNYPFPFCTQTESIRDAHWKLIRELYYDGSAPMITPDRKPVRVERELYDIQKDPEELENVIAVSSAVAADLEEKLAAWKTRAQAFLPGARATTAVPAGMVEKARERGYW